MPAKFWSPLIIAADVASAACWAWLLFVLRWRLSSHRLFPRQLRSLGVVGLLLCASVLPVHLAHGAALPSTWTPSFANLVLCQISYDVFRTLRLISVLQEAHLAAAFLAQSAKWHVSLRVLNRTIPAVWASGLFLGVADSVLTKWQYDVSDNECVSTGPFNGVDVVSVGVLSFCMAISVLACLELCRSTWRTVPGSVRRRSFTRAAGYPVISVISYLPTVVEYIRPDLFHDPPWYHPFAAVLNNSNGLFNVVWAAYALKSCRPAPPARDGGSAARARLRGDLPRGQSVASVHVLFRGVDVELFDTLPFETLEEDLQEGIEEEEDEVEEDVSLDVESPKFLEDAPFTIQVDDSDPSLRPSGDERASISLQERCTPDDLDPPQRPSGNQQASVSLQERCTPDDLDPLSQTSRALPAGPPAVASPPRQVGDEEGRAGRPPRARARSKERKRAASRSRSAERGVSNLDRAIRDLGFAGM